MPSVFMRIQGSVFILSTMGIEMRPMFPICEDAESDKFVIDSVEKASRGVWSIFKNDKKRWILKNNTNDKTIELPKKATFDHIAKATGLKI